MSTSISVDKFKENLLEAALRAKENAYCPISHFAVGASVLTSDNKIFSGCNVENVCLPCGWCAEVSAIGTAVSNGHRKLTACAVATNSPTYVTPCGRCRQVIAEFSDSQCIIFLVNKDKEVKTVEFGELLPSGFSNEDLKSGCATKEKKT
ncbi:unnamed protein product [Trichobilharzia szidati]|nr:unnamed protein product [Trichobilharzia szidati]